MLKFLTDFYVIIDTKNNRKWNFFIRPGLNLSITTNRREENFLLHIVSDSSCDLPEDYMKEHGINTVPLVIRIGNREYMEGVDISSREFYEKMKSSPVLPKTAQPSPAAFARVFDMLSRPGDEILCLTISSKLSGTFQSACIGQAMSTSNVTVFDTLAASSGHALQIMKAVELASRGFSVR